MSWKSLCPNLDHLVGGLADNPVLYIVLLIYLLYLTSLKTIKGDEKLKNQKTTFTIASVGTDGMDGNTKFAGSIFSTDLQHDGKPYLKNNDSSSFFKKFGGLIETGITQNNVNDIGIIIRHS